MDYTAATEPPPQEGCIDMKYLKSFHGIIKLVQAVSSMIGFIIVTASPYCTATLGAAPYFNFVAMASVFISLILWLIGLLRLKKKLFRCSCINWPYAETFINGGVCVFYFFAFLVLAILACWDAHKAAVAFGFFALVAFGADFALSLKSLLQMRRESRESTSVSAPVTGTTTPTNPESRY